MEPKRYSLPEWHAEAERRFGKEAAKWKFICPVCRHIQSVEDYRTAGAPAESIAFSCVGRFIKGSKQAFEKTKKGPCTYAGGGLFKLNPIRVTDDKGIEHELFDFAEAT